MRTLIIVGFAAASITAVGLHSGVAAAEPPGETDPTLPPSAVAPLPRDTDHDKSIATAYVLSAAAFTASGLLGGLLSEDGPKSLRDSAGVIATAGMILAPSVGHWYAGHYLTTGLVIRLGAVGGLVAWAISDPHPDDGALIMGLIAGLGAYEVGMIWDLATLPRAVRRYNREHAVYVTPLATSSGGGLALGGTF